MTSRRHRHGRPARRAILIVCEGAQTEPCYFKALVRRLGLAATVEVVIRGDTGYTDPANLVLEAERLTKERERDARNSLVLADFEDVWVVFDIEHPGNGRHRAIAPAVQRALAAKFVPILSRPGFEVWYLLHDRPTLPALAPPFTASCNAWSTCPATLPASECSGSPYPTLARRSDALPIAHRARVPSPRRCDQCSSS